MAMNTLRADSACANLCEGLDEIAHRLAPEIGALADRSGHLAVAMLEAFENIDFGEMSARSRQAANRVDSFVRIVEETSKGITELAERIELAAGALRQRQR